MDMRALEAYVASVPRLRDASRGVECFDFQQALRFEFSPTTVKASVGELRGLTAAGLPVWRAADEPPLQSAAIDIGRGHSHELTLRILVNPRANPAAVDATPTPKFLCELTAADAEADGQAGMGALDRGSQLDLGTYLVSRQSDEATEVKLVRRPPLVRLGGLMPLDQTWRSWTEPLVSHLERALELQPSGSTRTQLERIAANWWWWTLSRLAEELCLLDGLRSVVAGDRHWPADERATGSRRATLDRALACDAASEELPTALARLIHIPDKEIGPPIGPAPKTSPSSPPGSLRAHVQFHQGLSESGYTRIWMATHKALPAGRYRLRVAAVGATPEFRVKFPGDNRDAQISSERDGADIVVPLVFRQDFRAGQKFEVLAIGIPKNPKCYSLEAHASATQA
jgi:hypothetical protein